MNTAKFLKLIAHTIVTITLAGSSAYPAQAQSFVNTQGGWSQVNPQVKQCINLLLSSKGLSVDQFAAAGIEPNDERVIPAINACNQYLTAQLQTNLPCMVANSKGQKVATTCNESYSKEINGSLVEISGDEFLRAAGNGEKIVVANFETLDAQNLRLLNERREEQATRWQNLAVKLRTNFACNITDSQGEQIATICDEVYTKESYGSRLAISEEEMLELNAKGVNTSIEIFENGVALNNRLNKKSRQERAQRHAKYLEAVAERDRYLATPEGKREAAQEAQEARMAARVLSPAQAKQILGVWQTSEWVPQWRKSANVIKIQSYKNGLTIKSATAYQSSNSGDFEFPLDSGYTLNYGETNSDYAVTRNIGRLKVVLVTNIGTATFYPK